MCIKLEDNTSAASRPRYPPHYGGGVGAVAEAANHPGTGKSASGGAKSVSGGPIKLSAGKRLSAGQKSTSSLATKVKRVINYEAGRLEPLLLPVLVTLGSIQGQTLEPKLSDLPSPAVTDVDMDSTWMLDVEEAEEEGQGQLVRNENENGTTATVDLIADPDFDAENQRDHQEEAVEDKENRGFHTHRAVTQQEEWGVKKEAEMDQDPKLMLFINTLLHALSCK